MSKYTPYEEPEQPMYPMEPTTEAEAQKWYKKNGNRRKKLRRRDLTPEQRKKRTIKGLIKTGIVFACIFVLIGILAIVNVVGVNSLVKLAGSFNKVAFSTNEQLVPVKDADGYWTFTTDDDFKILQFTDVHIGGGFSSQNKDRWALNAVSAMISVEKPDLVVVTGDIAYPVPFQAGTFNNLSATKIFANMMESLGVYWTFTFGNHDTEAYSYYSRAEICDWYAEQGYRYCLFNAGFSSEELGYGNNIIKVKKSNGVASQAIVTLDSHSYIDGDIFGMAWKYDNIHQSQVDWYAAEMDKINAANKAIDPSAEQTKNLAFMHIPLVEYRDAWKEYLVDNNGADGGNVELYYGNTESGTDGLGESDKVKNGVRTYRVYCGYNEDNLFEVGQEKGLQGVFAGHDHYNNFSIDYKGIRLTYGLSIDYLAYAGIQNEQAQRGCTIITVHSDGSMDNEKSNYYQEKYVAQFDKK